MSIYYLSWRRQWHPTPVLLPGISHGWRSLVGCSPWGHQESDTTERLHFHFSLSCIGEGNGNPFQCSCLENPRDGGAWWAAVYGVAQSRIQMKWLSSSILSLDLWELETQSPFFKVQFWIIKHHYFTLSFQSDGQVTSTLVMMLLSGMLTHSFIHLLIIMVKKNM